jgi:hypothetical protein
VKASKTITIATLTALSLSLTACADNNSSTVVADCAARQPDGSYKAVDDKHCDKHSGGGGGGGAFVWMYGGTRASNGRIHGGTLHKPANTNINTRSGRVVVGGFGSSGKGGSGS